MRHSLPARNLLRPWLPARLEFLTAGSQHWWQHGFLRDVARDERNPVEVICRAVAGAMEAGEIPRREPELVAMALIGLIVQPATARLYGRLQGGLLQRADDIVAMCWRALS